MRDIIFFKLQVINKQSVILKMVIHTQMLVVLFPFISQNIWQNQGHQNKRYKYTGDILNILTNEIALEVKKKERRRLRRVKYFSDCCTVYNSTTWFKYCLKIVFSNFIFQYPYARLVYMFGLSYVSKNVSSVIGY